MSKSLVLGNGNMLVCLDGFGQVNDFYFPHVGLENHTVSGFVHKVGVWTPEKFSWLSDGSWETRIDYAHETMASDIIAHNASLGLTLFFTDVVYNERNVFIRHVTVKNERGISREVRLYFNQQLQIAELRYTSTAYFAPDINAIVHYRGRRVFLITGECDAKRFVDYSVGLLGIEGREGTWREAERGTLSKNPIEHGSVDSTISFTLMLEASESKQVTYWITAAHSFEEALEHSQYLEARGANHLLETTQRFWHAWVNKRQFNFYGLSDAVSSLFKKSLLIMRTHADNGGAIIASGDSDILQNGRDTYVYTWPRDASLICRAFDKAGYFDVPRRFFEFCNDVIVPQGYLLHKYRTDRSVGSSWHPWIKNGERQLAIQEDETALVLDSLWHHYALTKDLEFIESIYNTLIKRAADFLVSYRETELPFPSYDLWEEKYGIHLFTVSAVYGALIAASKFADVLGKESDFEQYHKAAEIIRRKAIDLFFDEELSYFSKSVSINPDGTIVRDRTVDISSFYGIYIFGMLDVKDKKMRMAYETAKKKLSCDMPCGVIRYEGDRYFAKGSESNPWFVTTLWLMQYEIACAKKESDFVPIRENFDWILAHARTSGILSEQLDPHTGEQLSVGPLTWSHAEFVRTTIQYLERAQELGLCKDVCYPLGLD